MTSVLAGKALKLMSFVVERAAEPLGARLEGVAAKSPHFGAMCVGLANWYSTFEFRKQERRRARGSDGLPDVESMDAPKPLSKREATELGCGVMPHLCLPCVLTATFPNRTRCELLGEGSKCGRFEPGSSGDTSGRGATPGRGRFERVPLVSGVVRVAVH